MNQFLKENSMDYFMLDISKSLNTAPKTYSGISEESFIKSTTKLIKDYLSKPSKQTPAKFTTKDYSGLRELAVKGIDVTKLPETLDAETLDQLVVDLPDFNAKLQNLIPVNLATTILGVDERDPSSFEKAKFIRSMTVVLSPLGIIESVVSDNLSMLEIEVLEVFYPELYQLIKDTVLETVASFTGDKNLTRKQNNTLATLLKIPRLTPDILKPIEEGNTKADLKIDDSMTDTQRVSNK